MGLDKYIPGSMQGVEPNSLVIDVTYAELVDKISLSALVPGQKYRITDYRTAYNMPNVTPAEKIVCTVEPLLVTANSVNTLSMYAYSEAFPQDEIYYDVTNNQTLLAGCDMGYIYRRVDKLKNIDIGFDWRKVKFRRWKIDTTIAEWAIGTTYDEYAVVKGVGNTKLYVSVKAGNVGNALTTCYWVELPFCAGEYISPTSTAYAPAPSYIIPFTVPVTADYYDYYIFSKAPNNTGDLWGLDYISNVKIVARTNDLLGTVNSIFFMRRINNLQIKTMMQRFTIYNADPNAGGMFNIEIGSFSDSMIRGSGFFSNKFEQLQYIFINGIIGNNVLDYASIWFGLGAEKNKIAYINKLFSHTYFNENTGDKIQSMICADNWEKNLFMGTCSGTFTGVFQTNIIQGGLSSSSVFGNQQHGNTFINVNNNPILTPANFRENVLTYGTEGDYSSATNVTLRIHKIISLEGGVKVCRYVKGNGQMVIVNALTDATLIPKEYTALITQASTDAPVATALTNGLSAAIVWARTSAGVYTGTLAGAFTENKTVFAHSQLPVGSVSIAWTSADVVTITAKDAGGSVADDLLTKFSLTIKVYP